MKSILDSAWTIILSLVIISAMALETGCRTDAQAGSKQESRATRAVVSENGLRVDFPKDNPGLTLIHAALIEKGKATVSVVAPARVVATIGSTLAGNERTVLFDASDVTSLYSQYRQGRVNADRAARNFTRMKEMYDNHAATAKDLLDAETDAANAKTAMAEFEVKMRALGFNPDELATVPPGTAWMMCDVTESQLPDVQKGEDVDVVFSAYPGSKVIGKADAVGDVVDPITRTVKVRVSVKNPHNKFLPGMYARVDFGDPIENAILLPLAAVVTVEGNDFVFVERSSGSFERRRVTLMKAGEQQVVVLQGVEGGERVVVDGAMLLKGLSFGY